MPSLGYLEFVDTSLEYGRGYGVSIIGVSITLERLQHVYPNCWKTLLSSSLVLFFSFAEQAVAKYISERLGSTTVLSQANNHNLGSQRQEMRLTGSVSSGKSSTQTEVARPAQYPHEVALLPQGLVVAFYQAAKPILCRQLEYYSHREWRGFWDRNVLL